MTSSVYASGPFNLEQGDSYSFILGFFSSSGALLTPTSPVCSVSYTNTSNTATSDSVTLTQTGSFYTGTWSSTSAALGLATWSASGDSAVNNIGQIRVMQRQYGD